MEKIPSSVLILKEKFRNHELSKNLTSSFKLKFSSKINIPDIVITECQPSLAIIFFETSQNSLNDIISGLKMYNNFGNCIGIIIIDENDGDDIFNQININFPPGTMRLFKAYSYNDVLSIIMIGYESMRDTKKFEKQVQFFNLVKESLTSSKTAKQIAYTGLERMNINSNNAKILLDAYPNLLSLISANKEDLNENCPADSESIEILTNFFSFKL